MSHFGKLAEMEWRDALCLGDAVIDAQHKGFIDQAKLVGSLIATKAHPAVVLANVEAIVMAAGHHFNTEEAIMVERGFPSVSEHRLDHSVIYDQISHLVSPLSIQSAAEEVETAVRGIIIILLEHMMLMDMAFRPFLVTEPVSAPLPRSFPSRPDTAPAMPV